MNIPNRFKNILSKKDIKLAETIINIDKSLALYLEFGKLEYFPEYTEHGLKHVERVLEFADKLIPDSVIDKLRPEDIQVLVLAIYLHDLGMLIRPDGVLNLIKNKKWNTLWVEYCSWLQRADDKKLYTLYGEIPQIAKYDIETLVDSNDRQSILTIGEFLRWNHHKLAEEIAINGMFGNGKFHKIFNGIEKNTIEIIAILAKSHGLDLRELNKEMILNSLNLRPKYDPNIPFLYLACIVRLADLLDACNQRAPKIISEIQNMYSPYSIKEHEFNQCLDYERFAWGINGKNSIPKETLIIPAEIDNAPMYVKLKEWLVYTQHQLDLSWARLAEYHYDEYRMSIHRISSEILDEDYRMRSVFLPSDVAFTANPDILKLLIAPLYGNNPSYGVRELLQNAVDACLERAQKTTGNYKPKISVRLDRQNNKLVIEDNGIGMTANIITDYFLKAGASFRNSDIWKKDFSFDSKKSKIIRTGRFGIGALAAFLIGPKIHIVTRHMNDDRGYLFDVRLEDELINVKYIETKFVGTKITIDDADISRFLANYRLQDSSGVHEWDTWFYYSYPSITYWLDGKETNMLDKKDLLPTKIENTWMEVTMKSELNCLWKADYSSRSVHGINIGYETKFEIFCNGFYIGRKFNIDAPKYLLPKAVLTISFSDPNAVLPIDLRRNNIDYEYRKDNCGLSVLEESIYRYSFAMMVLGETECVVHYKKGFIPKMRSIIDTIDEITVIGIATLNNNVYCDLKKLVEASEILNAAVFLQTREYEDDWVTDSKKHHDNTVDIKNLMGVEVELTTYSINKLKDDDIKKFNQLNPVIHKIMTEIFSSDVNFWFPIDLNERKNKYGKAFDSLNSYLLIAEEDIKSFKNYDNEPSII